MKRIFFTILFSVPVILSAAVKPYDWEKTRSLYKLSEKELALAEYVLKYHRQFQYEFDKEVLYVLATEHRITRVTNSESIERNNRIYVSMRGAQEIINLKARAINKKGVVTDFDSKNLKELKNEDSSNSYKIFAIEGIESESEVEYFYTLKITARYFDTFYLQTESPMRESSFMLTSPKKFLFDLRIYNDTTTIKPDTLVDGSNRYQVVLQNVPGLRKESFSYFDACRKRVDFKLAYNLTTSTMRLNTWADAGKTIYRNLIKGSIDANTFKKFMSTLEDKPAATPSVRIRNIEDRIKRNFKITKEKSADTRFEEINSIVNYKVASVEGITRLYMQIFESLNIPYQLAITCDREKMKFDGSFDSWSSLDEYLFYFPQTNEFITPEIEELRCPFVPFQYTATDGLFIEPIVVGTIKSAITSIRQIPASPYNMNADNMDIDVAFDEPMETNTINIRRTFTGYQALIFTAYYNNLTEDKKKEFVDGIFRQSIPDLKMIKWSVSSPMIGEVRSFSMDVSFTTSHFIDRAGMKVLFKAGELIGPQSELYRDDERQTDVENSNNRGYDRTIVIHLPKGIAVGNAEALKIDKSMTTKNEKPFLFLSDFTLGNDALKITAQEYYKEIYAPKSRYEEFRQVINAAADFNKVTLVLSKK